MADLAFPQLSSGALVQYPLRKRRLLRSPINTFADGSVTTSNLNPDSRLVWELAYGELTVVDQSALQAFFLAVKGPLLPFTFIDPTDNMLSSSSDLAATSWILDPLLSVSGGAADPLGGSSAFTLVNSGQIDQELTQQVLAPANFQYCFSVYASSPSASTVRLVRGAVSEQSETFPLSSTWNRFVSSGQLSDAQAGFNVSIVVPAGQSLTVFGPQLEPQLRPSRYRATAASGGVYSNAHILGDSLTFGCDAPGLFSTFISIETT